MDAREALLRSDLISGRHPAALPDLHARRVRLGQLRRGARAAAPGRAQPAARGAHDDPGGVGERPGDGPGEAGVLPVPRQPDGAVGRPGVASRSPTARSSARCWTATGCGPAAGGAPTTGSWCSAARRACSTSTRPRWSRKGRLQPGRMFLVDTAAGRIVDDDEIKAELAAAAAVRRLAARRADATSPTCPPASTSSTPTTRCSAASRPSATPRRSCKILLAPMARSRRRAARLDGHGHPDRAAVHPAAAALRLLPPALRAGHQPAAGRDPGGAGHQPVRRRSGRRATCSTRARRAAARSCCRTR